MFELSEKRSQILDRITFHRKVFHQDLKLNYDEYFMRNNIFVRLLQANE